MFTDFLNTIRKSDELVNSFYTTLHGGEDTVKRTLFGGILSLAVQMYVYYIAISGGMRMVNLEKPEFETKEMNFLNKDDKIFLNNTSKHLIEIWADGSEARVDYTSESRKFMHMSLV